MRSEDTLLTSGGQNASEDGEKGRRRKDQVSSGIHFGMQVGSSRRRQVDVSKEELQVYIRTQYSDPMRNKPLHSPGYVPRPSEPSVLFDVSPPKFSEVKQVIQRARSASAPGPNGIPYKLYKSCPGVLKLLWTLMRITWT